mmetsp:Transcript_22599/g.34451  ORF Transcript_22599/g.34451 Transcript_22599/m.34451 type:complete len:453 (+) Transcript_22599:93-1451(+)
MLNQPTFKSVRGEERMKTRSLESTEGPEVDIEEGQVHNGILHGKSSYVYSDVLGITIDAKIESATGDMSIDEKSAFENGMKETLKQVFADNNSHNLEILSIIVTGNDFLTKKDVGTLNVQSVVSAQQMVVQGGEDDFVDEKEFGDMVLNASTVYMDELKSAWKTNEMVLSPSTNLFDTLGGVSFAVYDPNARISSSGSTTGIVVACTSALCLLIGALMLVARKRSRNRKNEEGEESSSLVSYTVSKDSKLSRRQNIQDLIKGDEVTFAPYKAVLASRPKKLGKQKYSKLAASNEDEDNLAFTRVELPYPDADADAGIPYPEPNELVTFEDNPTIISNTEVVKSDKLGKSLSFGSGAKLATDGSVLKGECFAPPGKLGVAIDTINGQPVVHRVKDDSPLSGVLRRLDVIIGVDEVNTADMSAADVTSLVAKRMGNNRKITYLRGEAAQICLLD